MKRQEEPAPVLLRKLLALVELDVKHRDMRAEEHVRVEGALHFFGCHALVTRLFVRAVVGDRPAVEFAFLHVD